MNRNWAWIPFVWLFFLAEGRILDPRLDPTRAELDTLRAEQQSESNPRRGSLNVRVRRSASVGREERLDYLCEVFDGFQGGHTGHMQYFQRTGRLDTLNEHRLHDVDLSLDQRRFRTRTCCRKVRHHRYRCFDDYHIRRIDDYCGDGYPDIPFPQHTVDWHAHRQTHCCGLLAMDRIQCFQTTLEGAPEGESRQDDLDPADDTHHYIEEPHTEITIEPMVSSDIAVGHPSAYPSVHDEIFLPSSRATSSRSRTQKPTTPSTTEDVCCAAGSLIGLEVTSNKLRTCSRKARQARRVFSGQNQEMCETMARTCCLQVAMRVDELDDDDDDDDHRESSAEDRLLASVISATSSTDREADTDDHEQDDDDRSNRRPATRNGNVRESEGSGNTRRRGRTQSLRRHSRHRNDRQGRRRGRRRNRDRS